MEPDDEPTESEVSAMAAWLRRARQALAWRCEQPYDGVFGVLPAWVPQPRRDDFTRTRDRLLDEQMYGECVTPQQILGWMNTYAAAGEGVDGGWPDERGDEIGRLVNFRYAVSLGEKKGLMELGGVDAVRGRKLTDGIRHAHQVAHGTPDEKKSRWNKMQVEVDRLRAAHPGMSMTGIARAAGLVCKVSDKTITRHANISKSTK